MKINLAKLHDGLNRLTFYFKSEDLGFNEHEETMLLFPDNIAADVETQKFSDKYFIKVNVSTIAHYICDRCLEEFDENFKTTFQLIYSKYSRDHFEDDEYRFLGEKETEIDLSPDIRENMLLVLPMKHLCKEACRGLCAQCGVNLNYDSCDCHQEITDPRWEKLQNLQFNN